MKKLICLAAATSLMLGGCSAETKEKSKEAVKATGEAVKSGAEDTKQNVKKGVEAVKAGVEKGKEEFSSPPKASQPPENNPQPVPGTTTGSP
jgi:hypothetical protein